MRRAARAYIWDMTLTAPFDNSYARLPAQFFTRLNPEPAPRPELIAYNEPLGALLQISEADDAARAEVFSGQTLPAGAEPL
ncbi:MAG: hypothetical protein AAGF27_10765, partial [Pseudomonadota bacterium]